MAKAFLLTHWIRLKFILDSALISSSYYKEKKQSRKPKIVSENMRKT